MGLAAGGGGALAGVVVGQLGYSVLGACSAVLAAIVALASRLIRVDPTTTTAGGPGHASVTPDPVLPDAVVSGAVVPDAVVPDAVLPDREGDQVG
jgi:hypothetical protein